MEDVYQTFPEQPTAQEASISGNVPAWIKGNLLRNGPGVYEIGKEHYNHWFDGLAVLHNYKIEEGKVTYNSRYLRSHAFDEAQSKNGIVYAEFATPIPPDPCKNIFARFFSYFVPPKRTDNCSVNVVALKGKTYAVSDSPFLIGFDENSLQVLSSYNMRKDLQGPIRMFSLTPHPHEDEHGYVYNVAVTMDKGTRFNIVKIPPDPKRSLPGESTCHPMEGLKVLASFQPKNKLCYYHSFAMTPNYFVFIENPFVVNVFALLTMKVKGRSFHDCMKWDATQPSRFYLVERKSGKCIARYDADCFFSFHHVNAFESDADVFVDIVCYPDARIVYQYYLHHLRTKPEHEISKGYADPALRRYRIPIPTNHAPKSKRKKSFQQYKMPKYSDDRDYKLLYYGIELPQINYQFANGKPYRYVYGVGPRRRGDFLNQIIKVDVLAKNAKFWYEQDCYPSEPVFIAAPRAEEEDEGCVMSAVVGTKGKKSFLLFLDGKTFKELARAVVDCPIAYSLHGMF
ncbi:predicted protein, partial [Nematostella vectensis]